jgi:hypothetical protein
VLKKLVNACGAQIVDGAHRWYSRTHSRSLFVLAVTHCSFTCTGPKRNVATIKRLRMARKRR